jgi:excisionase family DNA binding protein
MSSLVKSPPVQRYGSASELATYAGLSLRTVRRRVADGSLRSVKLGRRVLIPFTSIDRPRTQEHPNMASAATTVSPHRSVDSTGRALPMTEDEIRARNAIAIRALDAIKDMGDGEEQRQTLETLMEDIDAEPLSDRKRFR